MNKADLLGLKNWFLHKQRALPWRQNRSPYAIWVSEIMLQQTQVATVIPYFERWMERFPTLQHLALSSLDEVLKLWEGLGYYSRARNLHEGAKHILTHHHGIFPDSLLEITQIKGIGPYTQGAIASFAFHQRVAAVDGNVIRVLSRYYLIEDDVTKVKTVTYIRRLAQELLPEQESWITNEALIELGALVCTRVPQCQTCPLKQGCQAYLSGKTSSIPLKSKTKAIETLHRTAAIIKCKDHLLVRHVEQGEIMEGLHEFPYFQIHTNPNNNNKNDSHKLNDEHSELIKCISDKFNFSVSWCGDLPTVKHTFTRFKVILRSKLFHTEQMVLLPKSYQWISLVTSNSLAFSSGHKKLLRHFEEIDKKI